MSKPFFTDSFSLYIIGQNILTSNSLTSLFHDFGGHIFRDTSICDFAKQSVSVLVTLILPECRDLIKESVDHNNTNSDFAKFRQQY